MERMTTCEELRPALLAVLEHEADADERVQVAAHLATCDSCRRWRDAEQRMTALLSVRARRLDWRWPVGLAATLLVAVGAFALLPPQPRAFGSIAPTCFGPSLTFANGRVRPLASHNHLRIPAHEEDAIDLPETGRLTVVGPAVIELDRAPEHWKLVLLRGSVRAEVERGAQLAVSSALGVRTVAAGVHRIRLDAAWFGAPPVDAGQEEPQPATAPATPAELLDTGHAAFFQQQDMVAAEAAYRAALDHADATDAQKRDALFYLTAAVARQDRFEDALALGQEWLELHPDDDAADYVQLFQGVYLQRLGRQEEAEAAWRRILEHDPASDMAQHARAFLAAPAAAGAQSRAKGGGDRYAPNRPLPAGDGQEPGGVVVVAFGLSPDPKERPRFAAVAKEIAAAHATKLIELPTGDLDKLDKLLRKELPQFVLFVVPPQLLDVPLHRRVLLLSAKLDADVFPDFSFGWFTARDGAELEKLWKRTQATRREGLSSRRWVTTFVTSGTKSYESGGGQLPIVQAGRYQEQAFGFGELQSDPDVLRFVDRSLPKLEKAGVITMTGNGDPQGVWLFDGNRNLDPKCHWPYDPARIGEDPDGVMPRIEAARYAALELDRPVVWSGTCHSAATHRVFVEGDIVSTFGKTDGAIVYALPPDESLALGLLSGGAVALLAPIGANHGYAVDLEAEFALEHGASLGETIKSTWDDVFLQARGELALVIPREGEKYDPWAEHVMQGGGANRALLGDPTLRPFERVEVPGESVQVRRTGERSFDVSVTWAKGTHIKGWSLFAADMTPGRRRIAARVDVSELLPAGVPLTVSATFEARGADGGALPAIELTHAEPEVDHGRRRLHLQAVGPEAALLDREVQALFHVTWRK